jgi:menaquinone-specific isochorismate synthase
VQATGATRVKKLHGIQHLHNTIRGSLKESISDIEIIQQLHPTPAVGAMPKNNSVSTIYDIEQWDRGWYAAPFGFISKKRSEISVAIRTALYQENQFHLFTGAGIVEGSVADNEWKEINHKMQKYLQIMEYDINR